MTMRPPHQNGNHQACGPDCRYRSLYEGAQLSLADMAGRQADALGRLGRLRTSVIATLRKAFPAAFSDAERRLGKRFVDADDEVLIAYLTSFVADAARPSVGGIEDLRRALHNLGLLVPPGDDLRAWAASLAAQAAARTPAPMPPAPAPTVVTPPAATAGFDDLAGVFDDLDPAPNDDVAELDDLFDTLPADIDSLAGVFDDEIDLGWPEPEPEPEPEPAPRTPQPPAVPATPASAVPVVSAPAAQRAVKAPLRPTPLPGLAGPQGGGSVRRRPPKGAKNRAIPAGTDTPAAGSVTDEVRHKLLAAVAVPRPVFMTDLAGLVSPEGLEAWELTVHTDPVRFLPAKSRHRGLGSLVVPEESLRDLTGEYAKSWWGEMVNRYRGAKLFELGVLMRRIGDAVVTHRTTDTSVLLRLTEPRGLVGMVVLLDADLSEGSDARRQLVADLEELLRERLTLIAVLTTHAEGPGVLSDVLVAEAHRRGWAPTMPVATSRSWEWAESRGSAAVMVLGA